MSVKEQHEGDLGGNEMILYPDCGRSHTVSYMCHTTVQKKMSNLLSNKTKQHLQQEGLKEKGFEDYPSVNYRKKKSNSPGCDVPSLTWSIQVPW